MTIPTEYHWKKPQRILFATNHYELDPQVLETLMMVVDMYTAELHVAIVSVDNDDAPTFLEHCRETPHYEQMLKQKYGAAIHKVTNLYGKSVEESLESYITQNNIDLLAMVPYKRNFPKNILFPSLTKHMACHTKIPLLSLHAKQD